MISEVAIEKRDNHNREYNRSNANESLWTIKQQKQVDHRLVYDESVHFAFVFFQKNVAAFFYI